MWETPYEYLAHVSFSAVQCCSSWSPNNCYNHWKMSNLFKKLKSDYLARSPREKWLFVRNMGLFVQKLLGLAIYEPSYKVSWRTYFTGFLLIQYFSSFAYTLWYYADNPLKGLLAISFVGTILPVFKFFLRSLIFKTWNECVRTISGHIFLLCEKIE